MAVNVLIDKLCKLWFRAVTLIFLVYITYQNKKANNIGPHLGRLTYKNVHGMKDCIYVHVLSTECKCC